MTVFATTASKTCFDISLGMKRMHRIEPLTEATRRYSHLDDVRKLPFKGGAATFVACHRFNMMRSTVAALPRCAHCNHRQPFTEAGFQMRQ